MTTQDLDVLIDQMERIERGILCSKGKEYTIGNEDRLYNFKEVANSLGLTALQVWAIYFMKHIYSILNYIKDGKESSDEGIEGRIADARNYLILGAALIKEQKNA